MHSQDLPATQREERIRDIEERCSDSLKGEEGWSQIRRPVKGIMSPVEYFFKAYKI